MTLKVSWHSFLYVYLHFPRFLNVFLASSLIGKTVSKHIENEWQLAFNLTYSIINKAKFVSFFAIDQVLTQNLVI